MHSKERETPERRDGVLERAHDAARHSAGQVPSVFSSPLGRGEVHRRRSADPVPPTAICCLARRVNSLGICLYVHACSAMARGHGGIGSVRTLRLAPRVQKGGRDPHQRRRGASAARCLSAAARGATWPQQNAKSVVLAGPARGLEVGAARLRRAAPPLGSPGRCSRSAPSRLTKSRLEQLLESVQRRINVAGALPKLHRSQQQLSSGRHPPSQALSDHGLLLGTQGV